MFSKVVLVICLIATICDSRILENITKCGKDDTECQTKLMQNIFESICKGDMDIGLPTIDPYLIKNLKAVVPNLLEIQLNDGQVRGLKSCAIHKFDLNLDNKRSMLDVSCKHIDVSSEYNINGLKKVFDADVTGRGNANIELDELFVKVAYYIGLEFRNGDIYLKNGNKKPELLSFKVKKIHIDADNILLDKVDASETVLKFLNDDPQYVKETFGNVVGNKVIEIASQYVGKIIDALPAKHFITDDLSSLVKN